MIKQTVSKISAGYPMSQVALTQCSIRLPFPKTTKQKSYVVNSHYY